MINSENSHLMRKTWHSESHGDYNFRCVFLAYSQKWVIVERHITHTNFHFNWIMKEGIIPHGLKQKKLNSIRNVGDRDNLGELISRQHYNGMPDIKEPSSTTMRKIIFKNDIMVYTIII